MTAYVVDFAFHTFADNQVDGFAVVLHVEPVAHVAAVAIDGKVLAFENILDDKRNQLFGEVIRTVVVGTAGDSDGHLIGIVIGHHYHIGTRLAGAVRAVRAERGLLCEVAFGTERAVNFVGRHLVVADAFAPSGITGLVLARDPGTAGGVEQVLCTQDVSHQEELGILYTTVYVALSSKVHYVIEFILGKQFVGKHAVADVTFYKEATFVVNVIGNGAQIACVGQGIQYHHFNIIMFCQDVFNIIGADKTGGTGYEISLHEN